MKQKAKSSEIYSCLKPALALASGNDSSKKNLEKECKEP